MSVVMSGKDVANRIKEGIKQDIQELNANEISPLVAIIRVGDRLDSIGYERSAIKVVNELEIKSQTFHYPEEITEEEFITEFKKIDDRKDIHGILLLRPLPEHIDTEKISMIIHPDKDIDGMSPYNIGKALSPNIGDFIPCTPDAVLKTLEYYDMDVQGKDVVIVGHSLVVGRPLSTLLMDKNATVTVCHLHTKNVIENCKKADILISAAGKAGLITKEHVKEGAIVIDVGTSYDESEKLVGDVAFDEVKEKTSYLTPVPGGIGAITTTILAQRVVFAAKKQLQKGF
ncbi:bifunctional 5,10-methylenetetrahydrofolate dehydrogenase/5,10-methenyltetrahydrofolate cyclohydrolase [Niallia sp. XMNu-256]|uniref:bifunctional 5,10-methylenetetrahydrofolate dehydrogenase/5,10-methenyltetrahydrofolate cyclohydrolase n=1 Tax=Niallia sp. XMNu-256 TaxID=3082444 RepID=UPI0030CCA13F